MSSTTHESSSGGVVGQAREGLGDAASSMQEKAGELKQQGRGKLGETLDQRTNQAGGQARQAADAIRQTGTQMRTEGQSGGQQMAGIFDAAAVRVEKLGGYLEQTSGDRMLHDVEDFARRQPWAVAGIGLLVGLAASRFLKASSERRYTTRWPGSESRYSYSTAGGNGYSTYGAPSGGPSYGSPSGGGSMAGMT